MTTSQLERFGDYIAHSQTSDPFTEKEVAQLQRRREQALKEKG